MQRLSKAQRKLLRQRLRRLRDVKLAQLAALPPAPNPRTGRVLKRTGRADSDATFAKLVEMPRQTVSDWLTGRNDPSLAQLIHLSETTNVSLDWLVLGEGGDAPVERGHWRSQDDVTKILAHEVATALHQAGVAGELLPDERYEGWSVDGARVLHDTIRREITNFRRRRELARERGTLWSVESRIRLAAHVLTAELREGVPDEQRVQTAAAHCGEAERLLREVSDRRADLTEPAANVRDIWIQDRVREIGSTVPG
jgi:transcriptional regulator with XRE-family HTH domain